MQNKRSPVLKPLKIGQIIVVFVITFEYLCTNSQAYITGVLRYNVIKLSDYCYRLLKNIILNFGARSTNKIFVMDVLSMDALENTFLSVTDTYFDPQPYFFVKKNLWM